MEKFNYELYSPMFECFVLGALFSNIVFHFIYPERKKEKKSKPIYKSPDKVLRVVESTVSCEKTAEFCSICNKQLTKPNTEC